jgi:hypothetical protein
MKKNFKFIMVCAAAIAMVACAKDQAPVNEQGSEAQGVKTYATVRLVQGGAATRVDGNAPDASTAEATVNDVTLFLFNSDGELESVNTFNATELGAKEKTIATYTGEHTLFVWANVPESLTDDVVAFVSRAEKAADLTITAPATKLTTFKGLELPLTETVVDGIATGSDFFMTTVDSDYVTKDFVAEPEGGDIVANNITLNIGRAVAKVSMAVSATGENQPAEGTVSSLKYKVVNNPKSMYISQYFDGGVAKTPFHDKLVDVNDYFATTTYKGAADDLTTPDTHIYIPENTNKTGTDEGEVSALMIQGVFTANEVYAGDGAGPVAGTGGQSLYSIVDEKGVAPARYERFYSASPNLDVIKAVLGFAGETTELVDKADTVEGGSKEGQAPHYSIMEWTNGECYYRLVLKNPGKGSPQSYDVLRNDWYLVDIASIDDIGGVDEASVTPPPGQDVDVPVSIQATISVIPWTAVNQTGNL